MSTLYSYVLRYDDGAAPNPFWGICTLAICKPKIRKNAKIGDWIIGLGSKKARCNDGKIHDFSGQVVYAMKISTVISLQEYDRFCRENYPNKMPEWDNFQDWRLRMGDCIYDFSKNKIPQLRESVHKEDWQVIKDLNGINVLLSDNYYYFGEKPIPLPIEFNQIVFQSQGHRKFNQNELISKFENWISQFEKNEVYADPQMRYKFDKKDDTINSCNFNC